MANKVAEGAKAAGAEVEVISADDFEGHSLSVSDVIALKRNGEVSVHYVDSIGFKDLQGFLDKQPERPSVLMNLKEKCDAPECNPTVCRKARDEHEL